MDNRETLRLLFHGLLSSPVHIFQWLLGDLSIRIFHGFRLLFGNLVYYYIWIVIIINILNSLLLFYDSSFLGLAIGCACPDATSYSKDTARLIVVGAPRWWIWWEEKRIDLFYLLLNPLFLLLTIQWKYLWLLSVVLNIELIEWNRRIASIDLLSTCYWSSFSIDFIVIYSR